jgi:SAM-dependent methyltransferase
MNELKKLINILEEVGPDRIRRPVYGLHGELLADGIADERDGHPDDFSAINFSGKTVVDLGCNFGHYSLLARKRGAKHVLGVDLDELVIRGAESLRNMQKIDGVEFVSTDFTAPVFSQAFDISLLIDFFGRGNIIQGINKYMNAIERLTREVMVISARDYYRIEKHFKGHLDTLISLYTPDYIRNGKFFLLDYIHDYFKKNWKLTILSSLDQEIGTKKTLLFKKK